MTELGLTHFLVLSAFLFVCGVVCIATKRNAIGVLMGVELVLNAANVNFVAFARYNPAFRLEGQVFALMVIVLAAAEAAVRVLHEESPSGIKIPTQKAGPPQFDWRELKRWGISESRLPQGSTVHFREPTAWQRYKWRIIANTALSLLEALLIFVLLTNLIKRRRAERLLAESEARFRNAADGAPIRIWVAGCATGEEAYSLAILLHERIGLLKRKLDVKIFATDVHRASLEYASAGVYHEDQLADRRCDFEGVH